MVATDVAEPNWKQDDDYDLGEELERYLDDVEYGDEEDSDYEEEYEEPDIDFDENE